MKKIQGSVNRVGDPPAEFVTRVRAAYDEYFLLKAKTNSAGGYQYDTDAHKFIEWLEQGRPPIKQVKTN